MEEYKINTHFNLEAATLNELICNFLINFFDEALNLPEYNDIISSDITLNL